MVKSPAQSGRMRTLIHHGPTSGGHINSFKRRHAITSSDGDFYTSCIIVMIFIYNINVSQEITHECDSGFGLTAAVVGISNNPESR